ncbi:MAG: Pr6Pr family membrane protein [Acholeplasmataceae bacterium]
MVNKIRNNPNYLKTLVLITFSFSVYSILNIIDNPSFISFLERLRMFTNISNILVFVILVLYMFSFEDKWWFKYLAVIGLVAILMTGIIFHLFVSDGNVNFSGHIVHTVNPIMYPLFYFLVITPSIKLKHFWVTLILPLIYFLVILLLGPFTNWYPYDFMNPTLEGKNLLSVLSFSVGLLLPVISVLTLILIYLKSLLEKKINS